MKTLFKEYFYPSETDIKEVWDNSLIVFDTCALLNLYRYTEKTRDDFVNLLESNKGRGFGCYERACIRRYDYDCRNSRNGICKGSFR